MEQISVCACACACAPMRLRACALLNKYIELNISNRMLPPGRVRRLSSRSARSFHPTNVFMRYITYTTDQFKRS